MSKSSRPAPLCTLLLPLIAAVAVACSDPVTPPSTDPVDSDRGAVNYGGGCYPQGLSGSGLAAQFEMISLINPHWVPVLHGDVVDSDPILIHGLSHGSHGDTGGDFPADHGTSDATTSVELDPADRHYLGTGNGAAPGARMELEWESGLWPAWARPGDGDRMVALGRWIFDCGHPDAKAGRCSQSQDRACIVDKDCDRPACKTCGPDERCRGAHFNYQTEMHPPQATAVLRRGRGARLTTDAGARAVPATRADVFVSPQGGAAGDRCVLTHQEPLNDLLFSTNCYPLSQPVAPINKYDFSFDVPLPDRPAGAALGWRIEPREVAGGVPAEVEVVPHEDAAPPSLSVRVKMKDKVGGRLPTGYAATIYAGWKSATATLTHVRVSLDELVIHNALKPKTPVVRDVRAWAMQAALNGEWQLLTGLDDVHDGQVIPEHVVFDQYLPPGAQIHLIVDGTSRRCIDTIFGKAIPTDIKELELGGLVSCLQTFNAPGNPGAIDVIHPGPEFGAGAGTKSYEESGAGADGGLCSATKGRSCLTADDCPMGETCMTTGKAFTLRYHVERLP